MIFNPSFIPGLEIETSENVKGIYSLTKESIFLKHDNSLKVGDIVPVELRYDDIDVTVDAKVVAANNVQAEAEFINVDAATANKILYLCMFKSKKHHEEE